MIVILSLTGSVVGHADENCFTDRGRIQQANITRAAVSGHFVAFLQRGSWDTRPTVRVADIRPYGIIDVSNPWLPAEQGRWPREGVRDVALVGELAAVAITSWVNPGDIGMTLVDLSQPSSPTPVGVWLAPSAVLSVAEYGGGIVVGTETDGLFLLDIEDPANPTVVDHWREPGVRVQNLATAWPTIATSNVDVGLEILGRHRSCIPPRRPSSRLTP